ncbi:acyltransferase [Algoriphagus sediminis]|uniref:Acyltransferase n=1 Tax=Algoriphagus sediminis TaxID=3057113 RepID=A0ABT7YDR9_9BACT|nr:acyltransferase [Algoriphagus sediminis]MDN3204670.1 acyltransferase [Algoriphagus sediminis]
MRNLLQEIYYFRSLRKFKKRGSNLVFSKNGVFIRPEEIVIGSNVFISNNFHISARNLYIGNDILIGPNVVIECDNHVYDKVGRTMFENSYSRIIKGVKIEDDVWIGANVTILPGVIIGRGSVIGAGSVVTKDIPEYSICVGNPCKKIKDRFTKEQQQRHINILNSN